jgi:16S rRNA A1518/A1519 N6-dimethyltransferase RsmA/KsgA/DIM1 with predicted DNA glycosylase/AP lyase activity
MAQTFCDVSYAFPIERIKFTPRPKVDSGLVKFQIKSAQHIASFASSTDFFDNMEELTGKVFRHKNKKLDAVPIPWAELGIDSNLRPHHLSPENIVAAVQKLYK